MIQPDKLFGRLGNRLFQMSYIYARMKDGILPDIYLQDYRLFKNYEKEIKELFGEDIGFIPYVGIHVRRGDYIDNPFYVDLAKTDYYKQAMELFPHKKFLVFSDDIPFCKQYFIGEQFIFSEDNDELTDFNLLASCEHQIIANSSFSWWCGYLNIHPNKIVVYSDKWFTDGKERITFPPTWMKIKTN